MLVTRQDLVARLGVDGDSLTDAQNAVLDAALTDAETDVTGYLGYPVTPRLVTESGVPYPGVGMPWQVHQEPAGPVLTATAEVDAWSVPTGMYTLVYSYGLTDPDAIDVARRFITASALNSPAVLRLYRAVSGDRGTVTSVGVDGQNISYSPSTFGADRAAKAGDGAPGSVPAMSSLSRWRQRTVFQRRTVPVEAFPYGGYYSG